MFELRTSLCTSLLVLAAACIHSAWAGEVAREHINPTLGAEDDYFFSRQAKAFLNEAENVLSEYPPQIPEPLPRRLALRLIDGVTHEPYAPCRVELQRFHKERIARAVVDMESRRVEEGAQLWKLYNHGFVVRTKSVTIGFDLYRGPASTDIVDKEGKSADVPCPGFPISDALAKRLADQCDVLFISHRHRDHADPYIAECMITAGKPVVATEETFAGAPDFHERLTNLPRDAHVEQKLSIKGGDVSLTVVVYPGQQYQGGGPLCNTVIVTTLENLSFAHNGDQINDPYPEYQKDFEWIDQVSEHFTVDVLMTNCWLNDPMRFVKGFDPKLVIMGHENEMGHDAWDRMPYWGDAEFIRSTYPQLMASDYPVLVMAWGESYHYTFAG